MRRRGGSIEGFVGGLFSFLIATVLVYSLDPALESQIAKAAAESPGATGALFWLIYYIHGFSVLIELVGIAALIGGAKS